ncbi:MAG: trypsin-like peptidase domain-containing protein [Phycisphaeraceae bacterium]
MRYLTLTLVALLLGGALLIADDANVAKPQADVAKPQAAVPKADPIGYWLAPKAFRAAVDKVLPSVVSIETYGGVTIPGGPAPKQPPNKGAPGKRPPARGMQGISRPGEGPTTGLIISEDGYIITSTFNFIRKPNIITVVLRDGSQHVAKLLGQDETRKICLLKIELPADRKLPVPELIDAGGMQVGQWSISVGVGYGDAEPAVSAGIISARNRISGKAIQTDANISPANYGGPLVDLDGKVIGICVPLSPQGGGAAAGVEWYDSGIGFAVPLHGLDRLIGQMKEGKSIQPGRMGVMPGPVAGGGKGVGVNTVQPKSGAEKAGLKKGDIITAIDGDEIQDALHLRSVLGRFIAGDTIKLAIKRGEEKLEIELTLDSGNPDVENPTLPPPAPKVEEKPLEKPVEKEEEKPAPEAPKEP